MEKILEFRQFTQEYLTAPIPNPLNPTEIINVRLNKPTERVKILTTAATVKQLELKEKMEKKEEVTTDEQLELIELLEDLTLGILNNNRQGLVFDLAYVNTYFSDIANMSILIAGMTEFIDKLSERKN